MTPSADSGAERLTLSISQQNIYNGVLQDPDPSLYLIGKSYRFHPIPLPEFLSALRSTVLNNPIQLCVLSAPATVAAYPEFTKCLDIGDIVHVRPRDCGDSGRLEQRWSSGILGRPLTRYTVFTDAGGRAIAMDVHTHHILLDGASTAIIEADLARYLSAPDQSPCSTRAFAALAAAHRTEATKVAESTERFGTAIHRELTERARLGEVGQMDGEVHIGTAARGVRGETVRVDGSGYREIIELAERRGVPLNILVGAAALAVHAGLRQSTSCLLVHPVDNRFGESRLEVATCLVNSVAQQVSFAPFAAVGDVVTDLDRGYVKAARRRWFREERYRRMYLAVNQGAYAEALTVNFLRGRCAPELDRYLSGPPVVTDIGPVEGMTVACTLDEARQSLEFAIWNRADAAAAAGPSNVAERVLAALHWMDAHWDEPMARAVGEWFVLRADGTLGSDDGDAEPDSAAARAWFLDDAVDLSHCRGPGVDRWIAEIVRVGAVPGDLLLVVDNDSQEVVELLIACHLAGCGYSSGTDPEELAMRATIIGEHHPVSTYLLDPTESPGVPDDTLRRRVEDRIAKVASDRLLDTRLAYVMPTSGSTGRPKLVPVTHRSLALFCAAARAGYRWGPADTVLQCAPLTSDISVEEIFVAVCSGARVVRSAAMRAGDMDALVDAAVSTKATVLDLPTAFWHLLCEDRAALSALGASAVRQVIVGGEAVRATAVQRWTDSPAVQQISLVSSYGPTETTVVVTQLPLAAGGDAIAEQDRAGLGRPLVAGSVFVGFGEVVVVGDLVSAGYLGHDGAGFGTIRGADGSPLRAFATADRVTRGPSGLPMLAGRRDAMVKIAGKRVDTAALLRRVAADPAVADVAVEPAGDGLGIWVRPAAIDDRAVLARVRTMARDLGVPSFAVVGVPKIPRRPNGKVDRAELAVPRDIRGDDAESDARAECLAQIWSSRLGRRIDHDASLLDEGIGSLDLIRILPDTRGFLGWQLSILDLIGADSAAALVHRRPVADTWMDEATAAEIADDLAALNHRADGAPSPAGARRRDDRPPSIVILGASGILGTGFAQAIRDLKRQGTRCPTVVFVTRSPLPDDGLWSELRATDGVGFSCLREDFTADELTALLREVNAQTVVNCIGNTDVLVPYRALRAANVDAVETIAQACVRCGARLVHLSTYVVNGDVRATRVTDPRAAPYPYAASKALAELAIAALADTLDFSVVRLPRVVGDGDLLDRSSDILVSIAHGCAALGRYPAVDLTEDVTTGVAAAHSILGLLPELSRAPRLGCGLAVLRGEQVNYADFLGRPGFEATDVGDWKGQLDRSAWARENPSRWAVIDAWLGLGARLEGRTYADFLADRPTIDIAFAAVTEIFSTPSPLENIVLGGRVTTAGN